MIDRLAIPAEDLITWKFQMEIQGFIVRYGTSGEFYYKQSVLQSGAAPSLHPVKRITAQVYDLALRIATLRA